jgi:hypothetical protein
MPDTVEVGVEPRHPMFLLGSGTVSSAPNAKTVATGGEGSSENFEAGKSLLCDSEGVVMRPAHPADEFQKLPILTGIDTSSLQPGQHLEGEAFRNAVAVNEALSDLPEETFQVRSVDVSKPYAVVVTDSSNARFTFGTKDFPGQIDRLRKLITHCQESGRRIATANLITQRNTPVTFVMTPEDRSAKITPVSTSKKPAKHP